MATVRARVDLLLWEAGASALCVPELGAWLWRDPVAQRELVFEPARGNLRQRSLAARTLAVAADGMPDDGISISVVAQTSRVARALVGHPESDVWIPAARALGRLASRVPSIRLQLVRWLDSERTWERRRTVTALASVPGPQGEWIERHLDKLLSSDDPWKLAALGPAVPYLARERVELWEQLAARLVDAGPAVMWSVTQGLLALVRRERPDGLTERVLRRARAMARRAETKSVTEAQLLQIIARDTDFLDGIDPDPAFPDVLLDRAVRDAVRLGPAAAARRARTVARGIGGSFDTSLRAASTTESPIERGHALAAVESCARAAALGLWQPILAAAGDDASGLDRDADAAQRHMGEVFAGYLELDKLDYALRRTALRALGNLIDAAPENARGRVAAFSLSALAESQWAKTVDRKARTRFRKPVTDVLWRVADSLDVDPGDGGRPRLGPLAAWWAIAVGGTEFLELMQLDSKAEQERVVAGVGAIRAALAAAVGGSSVASWSADLTRALRALGAETTMLGYTLDVLFGALDAAENALAMGLGEEIDFALSYLSEPISSLIALRRDPAAALTGAADGGDELVAVTVDQANAASWSRELGPVLEPIVSRTLERVIDAQTARADAAAKKDRIGPYQKIRKLGGGGQGDVWLVRRDGRRRYVVKIPHAAPKQSERQLLMDLLEREAKLLEGLHEGKVATYYDYGWDGDTPYLVLQYLIGTDLEAYGEARLLTVDELQPIVRDVCLGLRALHERGIVHSDLKPSNVFLRLQLPQSAEETFTDAHRDPRVARLSEAVLIDFGIARIITDDRESDAEGTLGFLSPEQALGESDISSKADVYGLGATVFSALTGRKLFQEKKTGASYLMAHAYERPFDNEAVVAAMATFDDELRELLAHATELDPAERPSVDAFADRFAALIGG
jgi:serine/threonine-protein kinase